MTDEQKKVLGRLQNQCARREYCSTDMKQKALKALDGNESAAAEVLASLVADKFVDDLRYCSAFAREKASITGWGPVKIRFALGAKHIDRHIIDEAISEIDDAKASEKLEKVLESKWKTLQDDPQGRLKLIKFALSRGYEYDQIKNLIK